MVRPTNDQIIHIDLSEPDNVLLYSGEGGTGGVDGFILETKNIFAEIVEYFR